MTASKPPGEQPPGDDTVLLTAALNHTWAWYDENSNRAIQGVNYFIVATAVVITAYIGAINGKHYGLAAALAVAGLALTVITCAGVFYLVNVAALAEPALTEMQERIGDRLRTDSMRIARLQIRIRLRRAAAIALFGPAAAFDVVALVYALTRK
jgi:hypothetical protein